MLLRLNNLLCEVGVGLAETLLLTGFEGCFTVGFKGRFLGPLLTGKGLILRIVEGLIVVAGGREVETDAREKELDDRDTETAAIAVVGTATSAARIKGVKRYKRRILVLFNECDKQDLIYFHLKNRN